MSSEATSGSTMFAGGAYAAIGVFIIFTGGPQTFLGIANIVLGAATFAWGIHMRRKARNGDGRDAPS